MSDRWVTPPQFAAARGVGLRKVLGWIEAGELAAVNMAASRKGRPRWKISPEAIAAFDAGRTSTGSVQAAPQRRRKAPVDDRVKVIEFF